MTRTRPALTMTIAATLVATTPAAAFKLDTHVWIAQQVLNDLIDDCRLTIEPFGEFQVREEVCEALAMHPEAYRMGTIGPDGFPDLAGGQMTMHPGLEEQGGWVTDDWLKWVIGSAREPDQLAFAYGYLTHAAGDLFAHSYVNTYAGDIFEVFGEQEAELRHLALEEYILRRQPPLLDRNGRELVDYEIVDVPAEWVAETVIFDRDVRDQYAMANLLYLAGMSDFFFALDGAVARVEEIQAEIESAVGQVQQWIDDLLEEIDAIKNREFELCTPRVCVLGHCTPRVCVTVKLWPAYCLLDPAGCLAIKGLELQLAATRELLDVPVEVSNLLLTSTLNPLVQWRNDVRRAIVEYIETFDEVVREVMKDHDDPSRDPFGPVFKWVCRWGSVFAAVPGTVSTPVCGALQVPEYVGKLKQGLTDAENFAAEKLGIFTWAVAPHIRIRQVKEEIFDALAAEFTDLARDLVEAVAGEDSIVVDLMNLRLSTEEEAEDGTKLRNIFAIDNGGTGLLPIPDIVDRVRHDMGLPIGETDGEWDPDDYAVIHNAIVLSKLLLLDAAELNRMVRMASVGRTVYGPQLYEVDPTRPFNVLFGALRSIDGNQQWQERGIPYPRVTVPDEIEPGRRYGFAFREDPANGRNGFRLWQDCEVRSRVFMTLFAGPIAPGIVSPPAELGDLLGDNDPNHASISDPFPFALAADIPAKVVAENQTVEVGDSQVAALDAPTCGEEVEVRPLYRWIPVERFLFGVLVSPDPANPPAQTVQFQLVSVESALGPMPPPPPFSWLPLQVGPSLAEAIEAHVSAFVQGLGWTVAELSYGPPLEVFLIHRASEFSLDIRGFTFLGNLICNNASPVPTVVKAHPADLLIELDVLDPDRPRGTPLRTAIYRVTGPASPRFSTYEEVLAHVLETTGIDVCDRAQLPAVRDVVIPPDEEPPALVPPPDVTVECGETVELGEARVADNHDLVVAAENDAPAEFPSGTTVVTWTAVDDAGNAAQAEQRVTVFDATPPRFLDEVPPRHDVIANTPGLVEVPLSDPRAEDSCDGDVTVERSPSETAFAIGETRVVWTARDRAGNEMRAETLVSVERLKGDIDVDGDVDAEDVDFVQNAVGETAETPAVELRDFDEDGDVDDDDRAFHAELLEGQRDPRDLDGDGLITEDDVALLRELCDDPACESDPGGPAIIADCFDREPGPPSGWEAAEGSWVITAGETLRARTTTDKGWVWSTTRTSAGAGADTYVIEFDAPRGEFTGATPNGIGRHFGVAFFWNVTTIDRFAPDTNGYALYWIDRNWDFGLTLGRWDGATLVPLYQGSGARLADPPRVWRIEVSGSTIRFLGDGVQHIEVEDDTYREGHTGFFTWRQMDVELDDVRVGVASALPPRCAGSGFGLRLPGDANGDGSLDIADGVRVLVQLFVNVQAALPCGDGSSLDPANVALLDYNADGKLDLADAVGSFTFLFRNGAPPSLGARCVEIPGCAGDVCSD